MNESLQAPALAHDEQKLLACVHCGLCLEACPTYVQTGDENDGPRGRIYLMRAVEEGRLPLRSETFRTHISRCLGCRACESACPAGVEYGQLLEAARSDIARVARPRGAAAALLNFALRHVWPHPRRLRMAFGASRLLRDTGLPRLLLAKRISRLLPARLALALSLLESSKPAPLGRGGADAPPARPAHGAAREGSPQRVLLFEGCVNEGLFARVNRATERVLAANGCETRTPPGQVCCGALHAHAGDLEGARRLARRNVEAFEEETGAPVVTNAGGCGAMLVSYGQLLAGDVSYAERASAFGARVRDVSQQLDAAPLREGAPLGVERVTYDASCHLIHGQRASASPLKVLAAVPGVSFVPLEGSDVCCGGAGVYNLLEQEMSERVLSEKLARLGETGAEILTTGNPGCHMQLASGAARAGLKLRVCHPVELLDESYRRAGIYGDE